eukprot:Nitzschia sp. Nitz4//scaffold13_size275219//59404//60317//NITZ4_000853-RA/size275219-processed-gene-0.77-mRNA-1//1//CDS//3329535951//4613//frame0
MVSLCRSFTVVPMRYGYCNLKSLRSCSTVDTRDFASGQASSPAKSIRLAISSEDDMEEVGALLSVISRPPDVILLGGDLGAGKTTFARGFVLGKLGGNNSETLKITSPTYLLSNTYCYRDESNTDTQEIHHIDLYRLSGEHREDFDPLQLPHVFKKCISLVEWPIRLQLHPSLFPPADNQLRVDITIVKNDDQRQMTLTTPAGSSWGERIAGLLDDGMLDDILME